MQAASTIFKETKDVRLIWEVLTYLIAISKFVHL